MSPRSPLPLRRSAAALLLAAVALPLRAQVYEVPDDQMRSGWRKKMLDLGVKNLVVT